MARQTYTHDPKSEDEGEGSLVNRKRL